MPWPDGKGAYTWIRPEPLTFPLQDQQSAAWKAALTDAQTGITQHGDVVLIRVGRYELAADSGRDGYRLPR